MIVQCKVVRTDRKKPRRSARKHSGYQKKFTKLTVKIISLKEDLKHINTPFLKAYTEHALFDLEAHLRRLMEKARTRPPEAGRKTLDMGVTYQVN